MGGFNSIGPEVVLERLSEVKSLVDSGQLENKSHARKILKGHLGEAFLNREDTLTVNDEGGLSWGSFELNLDNAKILLDESRKVDTAYRHKREGKPTGLITAREGRPYHKRSPQMVLKRLQEAKAVNGGGPTTLGSVRQILKDQYMMDELIEMGALVMNKATNLWSWNGFTATEESASTLLEASVKRQREARARWRSSDDNRAGGSEAQPEGPSDDATVASTILARIDRMESQINKRLAGLPVSTPLKSDRGESASPFTTVDQSISFASTMSLFNERLRDVAAAMFHMEHRASAIEKAVGDSNRMFIAIMESLRTERVIDGETAIQT